MARRKAEKEEVYYYPRIKRFETGKCDPKYFDDPNVNSHAEGYPDSPRFHAIHMRQLAAEKADAEKADAETGEEAEQIIVIDAFADHPEMVDAPTLGEVLFMQPDIDPDAEVMYLDDDEPDNIFL